LLELVPKGDSESFLAVAACASRRLARFLHRFQQALPQGLIAFFVDALPAGNPMRQLLVCTSR
jgi:hypothetical protein